MYNFRTGDYNTNSASCELIQFDTNPPTLASIDTTGNVYSTWTTGYSDAGACNNGACTINKTLGTCTPVGCTTQACLNQGCTSPTSAITKTQIVGNWYRANCQDGETGCRKSPSAFVPIGTDYDFYLYDNADNWAEYNLAGTLIDSGTSKRRNQNDYVYVQAGMNPMSTGTNHNMDTSGPSGAYVSYSTTSCATSTTVTAHCTSDTNGCGSDYSMTYMSNQNGSVPAYDTYDNLTLVGYSINWIKRSLPFNIHMRYEKNQKAGTDGYFLAAKDENMGVASCDDANLTYTMTITGPKTNTITGTLPRDGTEIYQHFGVNIVGDYTATVVVTNNVGLSQKVAFPFHIYPGDASSATSVLTLVSPVAGTLYANGAAQYQYNVDLRDAFGNAIYSKNVQQVSQQNYDNAGGFKEITTDMVTHTGNNALIITPQTAGSDASGNASFYVLADAPGTFSSKFSIQLPVWDNNYTDTTMVQQVQLAIAKNSFKKPYVGDLSIENNDPLTAGTEQRLIVTVTPKSTLASGSPAYTVTHYYDAGNSTSYTAHPALGFVQAAYDASYILQNRNITNIPPSAANTNPEVNYTINYQGTDTVQNTISTVTIITQPYISYTLNGQSVRWIVAPSDAPNDTTDLSMGGAKFTGVQLNGLMQATGKQTTTSQQANFSDLSKSSVRVTIKQNAERLIAGMQPGTTVNGIYYAEGDTSIGGTPAYETIIVRNGNLIISSDLNIANQKFGIIVLRDDQSDDTKGNIYVDQSVKYISAAIYGDGGIMSSNDSGVLYPINSTERTENLQKQLVFHGSLFTRNTIGGAILGPTGRYILPGGMETTDINQAMLYDLNYLRRNNVGYNDPSWTQNLNAGKTDAFAIVYDPTIQTNPPQGFGAN